LRRIILQLHKRRLNVLESFHLPSRIEKSRPPSLTGQQPQASACNRNAARETHRACLRAAGIHANAPSFADAPDFPEHAPDGKSISTTIDGTNLSARLLARRARHFERAARCPYQHPAIGSRKRIAMPRVRPCYQRAVGAPLHAQSADPPVDNQRVSPRAAFRLGVAIPGLYVIHEARHLRRSAEAAVKCPDVRTNNARGKNFCASTNAPCQFVAVARLHRVDITTEIPSRSVTTHMCFSSLASKNISLFIPQNAPRVNFPWSQMSSAKTASSSPTRLRLRSEFEPHPHPSPPSRLKKNMCQCLASPARGRQSFRLSTMPARMPILVHPVNVPSVSASNCPCDRQRWLP